MASSSSTSSPDILIQFKGNKESEPQPKIKGRYRNIFPAKNLFGKESFFNKRSGLFLYPADNGNIYAIGPKCGGNVMLCKINSADPLTGGITVYNKRAKEWVSSNSITMQVDEGGDPRDLNDADLIPSPPEAVHVKCEFANLRGGYRLVPNEFVEDRPVYYNETNGLYICYVEDRWKLIDNMTPEDGYGMFAESVVTEEMEPDDCKWSLGLVVEEVIFQDEDDEDETNMFVDPEFPPNAKSIGPGEDQPAEEPVWIRASKLNPGGGEPKLYDKIEPDDIMQGALGDCWLLAALSTLAEFPNYFADKIFMDKDVNREGKYSVYN